jgi:hypothetical protein
MAVDHMIAGGCRVTMDQNAAEGMTGRRRNIAKRGILPIDHLSPQIDNNKFYTIEGLSV